jgi:hypothetical protein
MKVLLDTNIIIHRETSNVINNDIGILFRWLDKLGYIKCVHPITIWSVAKSNNIPSIFTEDGPIGQTIEGVTYINPLI